jgi:hypothetical protein
MFGHGASLKDPYAAFELFGNITGWEGFQFWTRLRKVTTKWALQADSTWMS